MRTIGLQTLTLAIAALVIGDAGLRAADPIKSVESTARPGTSDLWIDSLSGEPIVFEEVMDDLAKVDIVYLGERHTIVRHHELQAEVVASLAEKKIPFALALEQLETDQQPNADRFNRGEIDFDQLAKDTNWSKRWSNYAQYAPILKLAQKAHAPVIALNARAETIRQVVRSGGVAHLSAELRKQLPATMQLVDPIDERLLSMQMMVHMAAKPDVLRPMIEAQMARDEAMAAAIAAHWNAEGLQHQKIVVLCGSGHIAFGLGLPARVHNRLPQTHSRTIIFSENGELALTPADRAQAREVTITHEQLKELGRPLCDYIVVKAPALR